MEMQINSIYIVILFFGILFSGCQRRLSHISESTLISYFGAKGDGITDDTKAIQEAVDSGLGEIDFSNKIFRITAPIIINLDQTGPVRLSGNGTAKIIMDGAGAAFRFVGSHQGTADAATVKPEVWKNQRMPLIDGLEIVGNHPHAIGIEATGTMQMVITRVLVREALHGIRLFNRNRNVIISDCHLYHNQGIGIYLDDVNLHQINIANCHISYNGGGGIVVRHGDVHNLQIGTCDIENNMEDNGVPTANVLFDLSEGNMLEGAIVGCTIQHDEGVPESSNIRFIGHSPEKLTEVGMMTIANNNLSETEDNVHIKYGRGIIVTGNTFYMGKSHNILVENSENILLSNNIFDRNPHYGKKTMVTSDAIAIIDSRNISIHGLQLFNTKNSLAGIILKRSRNFSLTNSMILNCDNAGIAIIESDIGMVSGNFIRDDRPEVQEPIAITIKGGIDNLITNNYSNGVIVKDGDTQITNNYSHTR